ncbi:Ig-like domain-containing protein [Nonomuraea sp. NPDC049419]|uniref:Ig-like domain-containing protein n=1 Tax=Nonomuraea sp. NPDC049419 TaxID=3155772 RepID=UPI0034485CFF
MRHALVRRLAAHLGAVSLITGLLTVATPAAAAADAVTDLGVSFPYSSAGLAVGGDRVFAAAHDRIIVADTEGNLTGDVVTGLLAIRELALNADGTRLYAALGGRNEVVEIDTASLAVTRRFDLSARCPSALALLGERLWVGHGCGGDTGGVVGLDLSATAPAPVALVDGLRFTPELAAAADTLVVERSDGRFSDVLIYDAGGGTPVLRGTIEGELHRMNGLRALALTPDGTTLVTATDSPFHYTRFDTRTLAATGTYGDGWDGYAAAVATAGDGAYVAAGRDWGSNDLTLYDTATGAVMFAADQPDAEALAEGLAFSGQDIFMLLRSSTDRLLLWRVTGTGLPASTLEVTAAMYATVGSPATIEGRLTRADGKPLALKPLMVTRRTVYGTKEPITGVRTGEDGTFSFEDTPQERGELGYLVYWEGDDRYRRSNAAVTLTVRDRSTLTLDGPETGTAGTTVQLTGTLTAGGRPPSPGSVITVQRKVFVDDVIDGSVRLPPVTVNDDGTFTLTDTLAIAGRYDYLAQYRGDTASSSAKATHRITVE